MRAFGPPPPPPSDPVRAPSPPRGDGGDLRMNDLLEAAGRLWGAIPEHLQDPVALAVPLFILMITLESAAALLLEERETPGTVTARDGRPRRRARVPVGGYDRRD